MLPCGSAGEANVWLYQEENELYAITTEPINARRPLKLGYSKKYAEEHRLPPGVPTLDLEIGTIIIIFYVYTEINFI